MTSDTPRTVALIVAAGQGRRAGGENPKQFRTVAGKPVIVHAVERLMVMVDAIHLVTGADQEAEARRLLKAWDLASVTIGADSRRGSVRAGLEAIAQGGGAEIVLIHDAARPFLAPEVVKRLLAALDGAAGAIPVLPVADTLVRSGDGAMGDNVDRTDLHRVQTPQAFRFDEILAAHRAWNDAEEATDDAQILRRSGHDVMLVQGDERLAKLTFPEDFARAEAMLPRVTRVGMGYDVHRLAPEEQLWLGGILVPHDRGLAGHSDADVALHAIVDAMLGALADGDIGSHFPPSDPQWRGASSDKFLAYARDRVVLRGGLIEHVDLTIICEAPKIGPHRDAMRQRIADILSLPIDRVSVKATTTERLGFAGRREGIAAQAVATLSLPALP
ncbi:bifunctional 2-C-methyl-D-erythritol 4-phosphate cytidylyltransferase/2-C-methyl-D-erythritol 2,4-cyclodiphosphate synthase [Sphingobium sp. CCH11-B1]|jgi:2-C-methyl-D-erythritol 4-phosphate cytidylyltransferase/2-C-methyl-D-erythritol 2,4-cyclodiphosphate synthase|uniref:bifunctional 2-C-methyl-D-erythritol 4-phosphate cytidylyltransferase/2-C-methyl-D-erythritol 2,4-cyclodiphosphate synthase n=1 Tax=Sphingobium sp. CCH11-B1 TaxID=1768781 RepID=UPI000836F06A|nr:bifunctional 2-C-methyl-D-erythritol 4-phosphate cytidylyltransferase/2-C-methyl-D-erythritol 2,4-cyclodiphosphate synthase [Sphingobium sp. CCH11-B1]MEA3390409.1 bifunctional 2-C-methyl-D-erythritol 4-phosphate cytidylyltransferase/2-C-methyl-D-erythritol 2,4-cyclodiphosphate synthase [Pseudomonadota bacterium]